MFEIRGADVLKLAARTSNSRRGPQTRGVDLKFAVRTSNSRRGSQTRGADLKLAARTSNSRRGPQTRGADLKLAARISNSRRGCLKLAARISKTRGADVYNSRRGFVLTKHRIIHILTDPQCRHTQLGCH